jgi:hypothetical protein
VRDELPNPVRAVCSQNAEQMIAWYFQPTADELQRLGAYYPDGNTDEACQAFTQEVNVHNTTVRLAYRNVVMCVKATTDLDEIAKTWTVLISCIDRSLDIVSELKKRFPYCGTPELHNNLLDYRAAAKKRRDYAKEEQEALAQDFPEKLIASV